MECTRTRASLSACACGRARARAFLSKNSVTAGRFFLDKCGSSRTKPQDRRCFPTPFLPSPRRFFTCAYIKAATNGEALYASRIPSLPFSGS